MLSMIPQYKYCEWLAHIKYVYVYAVQCCFDNIFSSQFLAQDLRLKRYHSNFQVAGKDFSKWGTEKVIFSLNGLAFF